MPVIPLPANPSLEHLKHQAKDLLKAHRAQDPGALQRIREFHPRHANQPDAVIAGANFALSDAQLAIAREHGFSSWPRLKAHVAKPSDLSRPHHERIKDPAFRRAVDLLDAGDEDGLRAHLSAHPGLATEHVIFEGGNYFRNPGLLEFVAENPVRHDRLPPNIVRIAQIILDAGAQNDRPSLNETLGLVASGRVPREQNVQVPLIDLLCGYGADPNMAMRHAIAHGEFGAVDALLRNGAKIDLPTAAGLGKTREARDLVSSGSTEDRHLALAYAAQFGHAETARLLLEAGEDPNRYNPVGAHSHSTPLHQAALAGHLDVVIALLENGARVDIEDLIHQGAPLGWAEYAGQTEVANYLRAAGQS